MQSRNMVIKCLYFKLRRFPVDWLWIDSLFFQITLLQKSWGESKLIKCPFHFLCIYCFQSFCHHMHACMYRGNPVRNCQVLEQHWKVNQWALYWRSKQHIEIIKKRFLESDENNCQNSHFEFIFKISLPRIKQSNMYR